MKKSTERMLNDYLSKMDLRERENLSEGEIFLGFAFNLLRSEGKDPRDALAEYLADSPEFFLETALRGFRMGEENSRDETYTECWIRLRKLTEDTIRRAEILHQEFSS